MGGSLTPLVNLNVRVTPAQPWPAHLRETPLGNTLYRLLVESGVEDRLRSNAVAALGGSRIVYDNGKVREGFLADLPVMDADLSLGEVRSIGCHLHSTPLGLLRYDFSPYSEGRSGEFSAFDVQQLREYVAMHKQD